ncbi:MAG TPA: DNA repair protein RecN [Candidatus Egerieimonas faecigallinarum]|nr:DNA repair protein RecN [Candidatus Egerieimonas faecigallinarum]
MLTNLHVKNLALISELEVEFSPGLNILTGETGAGKSILIGSINLALGQKLDKGMLRRQDEPALVELIFQVDQPAVQEALLAQDIRPEDGQVIITRKMSGGRSVSRINGETCPASAVRRIASLLLDIHGQHEHQSLLYREKQLEILDEYGAEEILPVRDESGRLYREYQNLRSRLKEYEMDEEQRLREISFLEFEIEEIENAALQEGEDEKLEQEYRRLLNARRITEGLTGAYQCTGGGEGAADLVGRALRELSAVQACDSQVEQLSSALKDVDTILNDFNRELSSYLAGQTFSEEQFFSTEQRLNQINHLKTKYGNTLERIREAKKEKETRLEELLHFQEKKEELGKSLKEAAQKYEKNAHKLHALRENYAKELKDKIVENLKELNFLDVVFEIAVTLQETYTPEGMDLVEYRISTNPGEPLRALAKVVSGGELSRIMLAIKTLLADRDDVGTLIFDEIDTGISGRTAQMVAEKMAVIGRSRQVLCITHLPQIAAMADAHFEIAKAVENGETRTGIRRLDHEESVRELARMLGGAKITGAVLKNAGEMKELAQVQKNTRLKN